MLGLWQIQGYTKQDRQYLKKSNFKFNNWLYDRLVVEPLCSLYQFAHHEDSTHKLQYNSTPTAVVLLLSNWNCLRGEGLKVLQD